MDLYLDKKSILKAVQKWQKWGQKFWSAQTSSFKTFFSFILLTFVHDLIITAYMWSHLCGLYYVFFSKFSHSQLNFCNKYLLKFINLLYSIPQSVGA